MVFHKPVYTSLYYFYFHSFGSTTSIYYFNNHFIANNIMSDVVNLVIKEHDFVDGQIIKVQGEWANERY